MATASTPNPAALAEAASVLREVAASGVAADSLAQSYRDAATLLENLARQEILVADLNRTLDKLDYEEDVQQRALLIDHAISLADLSPECAKIWRQYR